MNIPEHYISNPTTLDGYGGDFGMAILDGWNLISYHRNDGTLLTIYEPDGIKPVDGFARYELDTSRYLHDLVTIFKDIDDYIGNSDLDDLDLDKMDDFLQQMDWGVFYDFIQVQRFNDDGFGSYILDNCTESMPMDFRQAVIENKIGIKNTQSSFNICVPKRY